MARYPLVQGTWVDGNGTVVSGGTVTCYLAGTTTAATCYESETGSLLTGGATTSGTDGSFQVWISDSDYDMSQAFKIVLSKSGYADRTYNNLYLLAAPMFAVEHETVGTHKASAFTSMVDDYTTASARAYIGSTTIGDALFISPSAASARSTIGAQASDATLTAMAGVSTSADTFIFFDGTDSASAATVSSFARSVLDDADADSVRETIGAAPNPNLIINPTFAIGQRGTSFTSATTPANSDDTYLLDQWILLSDGNDIVDVTRQEDAPTGGRYCIRLDVETIDKKFGIFQPLTKSVCSPIRGGVASLSFAAKTAGSGKLDNLKAAVVSWNGTANTITSDIVSAWAVEDTNPTLVTNWTYENTPVNLNPTSAWATYKIENISIDTASVANVGVFIWSDVTDTDAGDFLYITNVKLEEGAVSTGMSALDFDDGYQAEKCARYLPYFADNGSGAGILGPACTQSATEVFFQVPFLVEARSVPTGIVASNVAHFNFLRNGSNKTSTAITFRSGSSTRLGLASITIASDATLYPGQVSFNSSAGYLYFTGCEL